MTFQVNETSVATGPATSFRHGPCGHLGEGSWVTVHGRRQSNGSVLADKIEMKEIRFTGAVATVSGACPVLTLTVNGGTVKTDAANTKDSNSGSGAGCGDKRCPASSSFSAARAGQSLPSYRPIR